MTVTSIDWTNKVITVDDDIDVPVFRDEIRAFEASEDGVVFDSIAGVTGRNVIGASTSALTVTLVNGYVLQFDASGSYESRNGNFVGTVVPDPGIFFSRELSIAFAEGTVSGLTPEESAHLDELHRIHGLRSGQNLVVTDTTRSSGSISQTIDDDGTTTTVTRN